MSVGACMVFNIAKCSTYIHCTLHVCSSSCIVSYMREVTGSLGEPAGGNRGLIDGWLVRWGQWMAL